MKRILLTCILTCLGTALGMAYDYVKDGIYYSIHIKSEKTVKVVCGNTFIKTGAPTKSQEMQDYEFMHWVGNSYKGNVVIPSTVKLGGTKYTVAVISMGAFCNCSDLESVNIPATVNYIGEGAFSHCTSLKELRLPDNIKSIGAHAFEYCSALNYLKYSAGCNYVPYMAFRRAGAPDGLALEGFNHVTTVGEDGFYKATLKQYPTESLLNICEQAFSASGIESVTIDGGCTIENFAFSSCPALRSITLKSWQPLDSFSTPDLLFSGSNAIEYICIYDHTPPELMKSWASKLPENCVVEVPADAVELYRTAPYWEEFKHIRAIGSTNVSAPAAKKLRVQACMGGINVSDVDKVLIYNASGTCVYQAAPGFIALSPGYYIVTDRHTSVSIVIRE